MASIIKVGEAWRAQVRRKGHPKQTKTFKTKILAERWARQIEADIDAGRAGVMPASGASDTLTVGALVRQYRDEIGGKKPFGRNKDDVLKRIEHYLGSVPVSALSVERLVHYITEERRIKGVTASIDLTYLGSVFKVARALWKKPVTMSAVMEAREVLKHMGRISKSNERDRRPTTDEIERIRVWLRLHSRSLTPEIIDFILDSGFRPPSEIVRLRWEDLNEQDRTIVIRDRKDPRKKTGNNQTVPLLGRCFDIIMRQPRNGEFIFPLNGKSWSSIFPRACEELEIEDLQLYDLRHEAVSRLVESGKYSIPEIMLVSGHKDPKQMMRYTQLRAKNLHR
jgi:integrase